MSLGALWLCKTSDPACTEICYIGGDGFIVGITTNVVAGLQLFYAFYNMIMTMPFMLRRKKEKAGEFVFTEHNPASRLDELFSSLKASLIYDLHRAKKKRIWAPFWDGVCACVLASTHSLSVCLSVPVSVSVSVSVSVFMSVSVSVCIIKQTIAYSRDHISAQTHTNAHRAFRGIQRIS